MTQVEDELAVWGDHPGGPLGNIPGEIKIDGVTNPHGLLEKARDFLNGNPEVFKGARRFGKDLVAYSSNHGRGILIGVGVASVLAAGSIVLYKHRHKK